LLLDNRSLVDARPTIGDEKRAVSEPKVPADLAAVSKVGANVGHISGMKMPMTVVQLDTVAAT
jgi:hypothetical protein